MFTTFFGGLSSVVAILAGLLSSPVVSNTGFLSTNEQEIEAWQTETIMMPTHLDEEPPPLDEEPPDDAQILRVVPPPLPTTPLMFKESRDDTQIVVEKIIDQVDPPRFYPLVGPARLHRIRWKCTVYFTQTFESILPIPSRSTGVRVEVVHIDKDRLYLHMPSEPDDTETLTPVEHGSAPANTNELGPNKPMQLDWWQAR